MREKLKLHKSNLDYHRGPSQKEASARRLSAHHQALLEEFCSTDETYDLEIPFSYAESERAVSWQAEALPWSQFARRMTSHRLGPKQGSAITPAIFRGSRRKADAAVRVGVAALDSDKGTPLSDVVAGIKSLGFAAAVATTHSNGTEDLFVSFSAWEAWKRKHPDGSAEAYLLDAGFEPDIAKAARLIRAQGELARVQNDKGISCIHIKHQFCPKLRVYLPVRTPWTADSQVDVYKAGLEHLAREIGFQADPSTMEPAHLFFEPRYSEGSPDPEWAIIEGKLADPWCRKMRHQYTDMKYGNESRLFQKNDDEDELMTFYHAHKLSLRTMPPEVFESAVMAIRNDERFNAYPQFIKVLGGIAVETQKDEDGWEIAARWIRTRETGNSDPDASRHLWDNIPLPPRDSDAKGATIIHLAKQDGWDNAVATRKYKEPRTSTIHAAPFRWRDPATLPRREWIYGTHLIRKFLSCTVAPGGLGKSSLALAEAVALAAGRSVLGSTVHDGPFRVWYWNGEDPIEEIEKRVHALLLRYVFGPSDLGGRLFINSGRTSSIILAKTSREGTVIAEPMLDALHSTIVENCIDVVILDPFVSTHMVSENDNMAINAVCTALKDVADSAECAIELIHHVGKLNGVEATVEHGRGASALLAAVRSARVLNRMETNDARRAGIDEEHKWEYVRIDNGKANLAPKAKATWMHLVSIPLGNGEQVAAVEPWQWPVSNWKLQTSDIVKIKAAVGEGCYRENVQSVDWVGHAIASALGLCVENPIHKQQIKGVLEDMVLANHLCISVQLDKKSRKEKRFIEVVDRSIRGE